MPGTLSEITDTAATLTTRCPVWREDHQEQGRALVVVSNRGPYEHRLDTSGTLRTVRGQGGVISALTAVAERQRVRWVAAAMTDADRRIASGELALHPAQVSGDRLSLRLVGIDPTVFQKYYSTFSNPFLWFLQHGIAQPGLSARAIEHAWQAGYVPANHAMAHAAWSEARRLGSSPVIMLHDYHLYLVGGDLRAMLPQAVIQHFIHIPWPVPNAWWQLSARIRSSLLEALLASDIVGVHTRRDVRNFLDSVQAFVPGALVDRLTSTVRHRGRATRVRAYPISVDVPRLRREACSEAVRAHRKKLASLVGERTIVRVDRLDPTKNIVRGFEAFELVLRRRPDLRGRVKFLSFLVPSRTSIPAYRSYAQSALEAAAAINQRYGSSSWRPVEVFYEHNYVQALAAMQLYDVLLVNPVADGMNLVSKEGPIVNERNGALVLSRAAGSYEQLAAGALGVDPLDSEQTSSMLEVALDLPHSERRRRADLLRSAVEDEDLSSWLDSQLADVDRVRLQRGSGLQSAFSGV